MREINQIFKYHLKIMNSKINRLALLLALMMLPVMAHAVSGNYSDAGGGTYWCNVYVSSVSDGKSYGWCTGKDEATEMNNFRGFSRRTKNNFF